jgi:hypothetical protein
MLCDGLFDFSVREAMRLLRVHVEEHGRTVASQLRGDAEDARRAPISTNRR